MLEKWLQIDSTTSWKKLFTVIESFFVPHKGNKICLHDLKNLQCLKIEDHYYEPLAWFMMFTYLHCVAMKIIMVDYDICT